MNTEIQAIKRGRGRPPKTPGERMEEGKLTVYLGKTLAHQLIDLSKRQHTPYSILVRQAVSDLLYRFNVAA